MPEVTPVNPFSKIDPEKLRKNAGYAQAAGIIMIILGVLAVMLPGPFSLGLEQFLGWLILFSGILQAFAALQHIQVKGQGWAVLNGVFMAIAGGLMIALPMAGVLVLTVILTAFYFADGALKLMAVAQGKNVPGRGMILVNGVLGIIIAGIVISEWPISASWFIGIIVGVNLLLGGMTLLTLASAAKKAA
ncbi:MAG: HdeD family acid-resistance protein [Puniceicoccales bacterium]